MEEVPKIIGDNLEAVPVRSGVADSCKQACLKAIHSTTRLRVELRAAAVQPFDMLLRDLSLVMVNGELVLAVRNEIRENVGGRLLFKIGASHR
jgi:hypothetical protein